MSDFGKAIASAYAVQGLSVELGKGVLNGTLEPEADVRFPLKMANRHGLIAGATGTGKTRTLQLIAEQLSAAGVPVAEPLEPGHAVTLSTHPCAARSALR